jgi:hypothetical protein
MQIKKENWKDFSIIHLPIKEKTIQQGLRDWFLKVLRAYLS